MPMNRLQAPLAALIAGVALAACTSTRDALVARGYAPAYAEGYEDGCASGKADAGGLVAQAQQDQQRYAASDSDYAKGWDAAFAKCRSEEQQMEIDARNRHPSRDK
jgi:hypothetical protein